VHLLVVELSWKSRRRVDWFGHALRDASGNFATRHGGYFTAKQAKEVGYGDPHIEYHESTGSFERVGHGL
jgi:hypothetical protein